MSWLTGLVDALKDGDLQGAVSKTSTGLSNLTDGLKERAKGFEESIKERAAEVGAEESALKAQRARQGTVKMLPWECEENQSIVAEDLMEKMLSLSLDDATFKAEPTPYTVFEFEMEAHVEVITRLLELDPNLTKVHYRLSAKMDEELFWRHYFHRCRTLRAEVGVDSPLKRQPASYLPPAQHTSSAPPPTSSSLPGSDRGSGSASASSASGSSNSPSRSGSRRSNHASGQGSESGSEASGGSSNGSSVVVVGHDGGPNDDDNDDDDDAVDMDALDAEVNAELLNDFDDNGEFDEDGDGDDGDLDAELEAEIAAELENEADA